MPASADLGAAADFIWRSARLIDRHRFAYFTGEGGAEAVITTLRAYQNADGGFGHALEPDLRAPVSQPQPLELALRVLDEVGGFGDPMVARACEHLVSITTTEGGLPFVLFSAQAWPHAPWWTVSEQPPASVNPTAAIAGLLSRNGVSHPWLEGATAFVWEALDGPLDDLGGYDTIALLTFLDADRERDRDRAEGAAERLLTIARERDLIALDPAAEGHVFPPLVFVPRPDAIGRRSFADDVIEAHLDALAGRQQQDGGWPIAWPTQSVAAEQEWRGWVTVGALRTLRAYGRI